MKLVSTVGKADASFCCSNYQFRFVEGAGSISGSKKTLFLFLHICLVKQKYYFFIYVKNPCRTFQNIVNLELLSRMKQLKLAYFFKGMQLSKI